MPRFMWALLALLTWSQLAFAAHQFEHAAAELHETCAVCLQLERNDDLVVCATPTAPPPAAAFALTTEMRTLACAPGFSHYRSRASP